MKSELTIDEIKKLYIGEKLSSSEIASKAGVSNWQILRILRNNNLPRRKPSESNRYRFLRQESSFKVKSKLTSYEKRLKLAACMLYRAEGVKRRNRSVRVDFVNSDPQMILLFLKFLRLICGVDEKRLKVLLYCYSDQSIDELVSFWAALTGISRNQFQKPYVRKDFDPNSRKMVNGLVHIRYNDTKLFWKIEEWINEYKEF